MYSQMVTPRRYGPDRTAPDRSPSTQTPDSGFRVKVRARVADTGLVSEQEQLQTASPQGRSLDAVLIAFVLSVATAIALGATGVV